MADQETFPSFPFYPRDWIAGGATALMSPEQRGAFIQLLAYAWEQSPPCSLPADDATLAGLAGIALRRWRTVGAAVKAQFTPTKDGKLRNSKQWGLYQELCAHRKKRSDAGKLGNEIRWGEDRNAIAMQSQCDPDAIANASPSSPPSSPPSKPTTPPKPPRRGSEYSEEFEECWKEYPRRAGGSNKAGAWRQWQARLKEGATVAEMRDGTKRYAAFCFATGKLNSIYVKDAATFYGRDKHYLQDFTPPDPAAGKPRPGSEAASVHEELPYAAGARQGPDPIETRKREEEESRARVAAWEESNPEDARALRAAVLEGMAAWGPSLSDRARQQIADGEYQKRALERLRPVAA